MTMFIRIGEFQVVPGGFAALAEVYARECVPTVRQAPGNLDAYLLSPVTEGDPVMACTVWQSEQAARDYEASGTAGQVVAKVRSFFAGPPRLRSYRKD
jgi:heme-degrading monooxygenase HmoA